MNDPARRLTRLNLFANYAGSAWAALMGLAFVPVYLKFIGAEGYGLVGFYALLASAMAILDGGLGAAATREAATFGGAGPEGQRRIVTLLRTLEVAFWVMALVVGGVVIVVAPWIGTHWLNVPDSALDATTGALRLMGASLLVNFPCALYSAALNGLQRQVQLNAINAASATLRGLGAVLVLWLWSPTVEAFFAWQCVASMVLAAALRMALWAATGSPAGAGRFDVTALQRVGRFAGGVAGVNLLALLLTQVDKIILSKLLTLQQLGYYTLAWTLATVTYRLVGPVYNAYYPRLTQLVAEGNMQGAQEAYRRACRLMALAVVPYCMWLGVFADPILTLWTRDREVANVAGTALSLLALGTMFNGFMTMPYALQLAHGWTKLALWQNVVAVLVLAPLIFFFWSAGYGLTGAATPWLLVNGAYLVFGMHFMHRRLVLPAVGGWYVDAVIRPVAWSAAVLIGFRVIHSHMSGAELVSVVTIMLALLVSVAATFITTSRPKVLVP
jgi:O-antigen/teichoic acid export membrane protein